MKLYCPECKKTYTDTSLKQCPDDHAKLFHMEVEEVDPLIGQIIDERFQIDKLLGRGGMGAVYTATQLSVQRKVALKLLRGELLDREIALERFYRESRVIADLSHPNIVRLIEFGQDRQRNLLYLVMELVDGINLGDTLEQGRFRAALALEIAYQVCGALTEPHARGVIHRDLKPDNLLLVPISDGTLQVKVLDFGIARAVEGNTQLTATGMVCGTPAYMAPEQAQNMDIDARTDLYALGIILYEMLAGVPPFDGANSLQIMLQHIQIAPTPLAGRLPPGALPREIEDLVNDMLSKDPAGRPASARAVRDRIDKIRRLHNIDAIRLDVDGARERMLTPFILPKLPSVGGRSGRLITEGLRRETGLEQQPGAAHSTDERASAERELAYDATSQLGQATRDSIARDAQRLDHKPTSPWTPPEPRPALAPAPVEGGYRPATASMEHAFSTPATQPATPAASRMPLIAALATVVVLVLGASVALAFLLGQKAREGADPAQPTALQTPPPAALPVEAKPTPEPTPEPPVEAKPVVEAPVKPTPEPTPEIKKVEAVEVVKKVEAVKKVEKPADKVKKPVDKVVVKPVDKPADKPADKVVVKPVDKPEDKVVAKPADKPADKPSGMGGLKGLLKKDDKDDGAKLKKRFGEQ